jgi:hypothetical protein
MTGETNVAEMMAEAGIWVSPTLQASTRYPRIVELLESQSQGDHPREKRQNSRNWKAARGNV